MDEGRHSPADREAPAYIARPLRDALLAGLGLLAVAAGSIALLYFHAVGAYSTAMLENLRCKAQTAAALVDGDAHALLQRPEQESTAAYEQVVRPLRAVLAADETTRFLYTCVLHDGEVYFVVDATPPGDADADGVEDHSSLGEHYVAPDPELRMALRTGRATVSPQPYHDRWGWLLSGYAPVRNRDGVCVAILGVDITADRYAQELNHLRVAVLQTSVPAVLFSIVAGVLLYRIRRREATYARERLTIANAQRDHAAALSQANGELLAQRQQLTAQQIALEARNAELIKAQAAAAAANRSKSDFLANTSHELRTPLTAILGYAELLAEEQAGEAEARRDAARTILRNASHLLALINDILDLSKVEAGQLRVEPQPVDVRALIDDVIRLMAVRAAAKGLTQAVVYRTAIPATIQTDAMRLRQILVNLIGNALKFTESGSVRLEVRMEREPRRLRIDVIDSGIGIAPEQLPRLFQPFSQVGAPARHRDGTGLGLSVSQRLATLLGGSIGVTSDLGHGSTFSLTIDPGPPSQTTLEPINSAAPARPAVAADITGCRVLLAEDSPDNRLLAATLLRRHGAEVAEATHGGEAVQMALAALAEGTPYDVILMDMDMPVLDGREATRSLRQQLYAKPIVALTAYAMPTDREKCLAAGCNDWLTKPLERIALIDCVARLACRPPRTPQPRTPDGAATTR